ncbi:hypothetical protein [Oceaniglobus trochenteri]|uniref:hypothetical protein n=1 Tax=Oceaniglobus trochenteri TaxID=2763260 RepID=UPI001CFF8A0E|nr:hypothetical protein [Oceaniglobus trochenteri]
MNYETKSPLMSRGVLGGAIALLSGAAGMFDYSVSPADQVEMVQLVISVVSGVGGILAIIGRVRASKRIGPITGR